MRTLLVLALSLLPVALFAAESGEDASLALEVGIRLAKSDDPLDLKAATLCFDRVIKSDPEGMSSAYAQAVEQNVRVKKRLQELARPALERARGAIERQDLIESERLLCEALAVDPFAVDVWGKLGQVRSELRREAAQREREELRRRLPGHPGLGVPPGFERLVNDPRFSNDARPTHSG